MKIHSTMVCLLLIILNFSAIEKDKLFTHESFLSDSLSPRILIISSFDAMSIQARKNKRDLFAKLTDSLKNYLAKRIKDQTGHEAVIIPGIIQGNTDSLVYSLINENKATKAILIRSLEVYFEETGEKETTDSEGKTIIVTSYDLCAKNRYTMYDRYRFISLKESEIENCGFFTTRSAKDRNFVISFGPDIVGKKKHTFGIVAKNAEKYVSEISARLLVNN